MHSPSRPPAHAALSVRSVGGPAGRQRASCCTESACSQLNPAGRRHVSCRTEHKICVPSAAGRAARRVLLARPRLVLMDESTSALDVANEAHLYGALRGAGITFVSIGHRPTLTAFHDTVLRLEPTEGLEPSEGRGAARNWCVLRAEDAAEAEAAAAAPTAAPAAGPR